MQIVKLWTCDRAVLPRHRLKPLRDGDEALERDSDEFFAGTVTKIVSLSLEVMNLARELRARQGF